MSGSALIRAIKARGVLDSRASPTIEVTVETGNASATVAAPSGKSKGRWEAASYPAGGVDESIRRAKLQLFPKLINLDACDQPRIDEVIKQIEDTE